MNYKNNESRTKKLVRNSFAGTIAFCVQIIVTFISRVVFIKYLGIEYLGINDLYTNILSILSLADLGFETVLMYSLYKPIAEDNKQLICELIDTFKKLYRAIAIVIFIIGITLIPFLSHIIKDSGLDDFNLIVYYLFFLLNSVFSYLMVYKSALLQADQNVYIVKLIKAFSQLFCGILQIILIIVFRNYIAYLFTMLITTIINNLILNYKATQQYPFLQKCNTKSLQKEIKVRLIENTKSVFLYKIGTTIVNSTDNIFISMILGSTMVGYYSNYYTVIAAITSIIGIFNSSVIPGIGNFLAKNKNGQDRHQLFSSILMFYFLVATVFSSILFLCINQFIQLWVGKNYILNILDVLAIIISFYFQCIAHPLWIFRETSGLFKEIKPCILSMAFFNIIFSYVFGKQFGIAGIIGATTLSRLLTLFWYEPKVLEKNIFYSNSLDYWKKWIQYFLVSILSICVLIVFFMNKMNTFIGMIFKAFSSCLFVLFLYLIFFRNSKEMRYLLSKIKQFNKILKK